MAINPSTHLSLAIISRQLVQAAGIINGNTTAKAAAKAKVIKKINEEKNASQAAGHT